MYDRIARYYDLSHDRLTADIPFLLEQAAITGGPLLELGCGSGRLLVPLARAGFDVTGVDQSTEMLARARLRLATESPETRDRIVLVQGEMSTLELPEAAGQFGLALFGYNTFMHLDETQAGRTMRRIRPLLRSGGRVLLDLDNPLTLAAAAGDPDFALEDTLHDPISGETIRQFTAYEAISSDQAVEVTWLYETEEIAGRPPARTKTRLRYHFLYPHQIELMIGLVGLRLIGFYGDYDSRPFQEDSERLLVLAAA